MGDYPPRGHTPVATVRRDFLRVFGCVAIVVGGAALGHGTSSAAPLRS